jgi:hypothetical protein
MIPVVPIALAAKHIIDNPTGGLFEPGLTAEELAKSEEGSRRRYGERSYSTSWITKFVIGLVVIGAASFLLWLAFS